MKPPWVKVICHVLFFSLTRQSQSKTKTWGVSSVPFGVPFCLPVLFYSPFTYKCHKSNIKNLLMKSSEIVFIFLPAFYLIKWLITSPKNSEKISILKIWLLVFFRVVKLCFGKFFLKRCIFSFEKYDSHK